MRHEFIDHHSGLHSLIHHLDPRAKIVVFFSFILIGVSTPPHAFLIFACLAVGLLGMTLVARLPVFHLIKKLLVILPFLLVVTASIPFMKKDTVAGGYNLGLGGLSLSRSGLWIFWNVLAKSCLGVFSIILLYSTTPFPQPGKGIGTVGRPQRLHGSPLLHVPVFVSPDRRDTPDETGERFEVFWRKMVLAVKDNRSYDRDAFLKELSSCREGLFGHALEGLSGGHAGGLAGKIWKRGISFPIDRSRPSFCEDFSWMKIDKVIEIDHLSYDYPDGTPALREIQLEVFRGESVAILGPNGAGKSTLLYHFNGTFMGRGKVTVLGLPVVKENLREIRRRVGLVFQNPDDQLFCPTVYDDVAFGPLNMGLDPQQVRLRVEQALEMVGLQGFERRSAHHLSEGEKKRVALATVLAMDSEILALDEPTDNLDPAGSQVLIERIRRISQTKVIITHHLPLAMDLCSRAVFLRAGRKVEDLPMERLLETRDLLERFGFDADFIRWISERRRAVKRND